MNSPVPATLPTQILPGQLTVVISAGQSRNPQKRQLEDDVAVAAAEMGQRVVRVPHLYDLPKDSETFRTLQQLTGDLVVFSWLFDRATHWTLDRNGVRGQVGEVELREESELDEDDDPQTQQESEDRVVDSQPRPARYVYCIDLRVSEQIDDYAAEMRRIAAESQSRGVPGIRNETIARFASPQNDTFVGAQSSASVPSLDALFGNTGVVTIDEHPGRRWYPVIDFSRCTNCMECIDFCLFGVYGVDSLETIVVEQADNCRKGCPACSRVCPENAIMFPQHKTPAIAGAPVDASGMKIDLSKLFGAPETNEDAATAAARERDEQLILAGRAAVGSKPLDSDSSRSEKRKQRPSTSGGESDELDDLINQLDSLDL